MSGGGGAGGLSAEGEGRESSKRTSRKVREVEKGLLTCERFVKECRVSVGWSRVFGQPLFYFHQLKSVSLGLFFGNLILLVISLEWTLSVFIPVCLVLG